MKKDVVITIFNHICYTEMVDVENFKPLSEESDLLINTGMDSFDFIMVYLHLGEIFGIDQSYFEKEMESKDLLLKDLLVFVSKRHTKTATLEEVQGEFTRVEVESPSSKSDTKKSKDSEDKKSKSKDKKKKKSKDSEDKKSKSKDKKKKKSKDSEDKKSKSKDKKKKKSKDSEDKKSKSKDKKKKKSKDKKEK